MTYKVYQTLVWVVEVGLSNLEITQKKCRILVDFFLIFDLFKIQWLRCFRRVKRVLEVNFNSISDIYIYIYIYTHT
jgi:hypothetical protein